MVTLTPAYSRALAFAAKAHRLQARKDGTPYIAHLLTVSSLVLEAGGTESEAIAALLHDYLEDIDGAHPDEISEKFGTQTLALVQQCTATDKAEYRTQILAATPGATLISAADSLHNLRGYAAGKAAFDEARANHYCYLLWLYAIEPRVPPQWVQEMRQLIRDCGQKAPMPHKLERARQLIICDRALRGGNAVQYRIAEHLGVHEDTVTRLFRELKSFGAPIAGGGPAGMRYGEPWDFRVAWMAGKM